MSEREVILTILLIGLGLAAAAFIAGALTPGRRALFFGISGFLVVAVPVAGFGISLFPCSPSSEFPGLGRALGKIIIVAGVIGALIVGGISAAIGGRIDRKWG